jgi:hypothetical protein
VKQPLNFSGGAGQPFARSNAFNGIAQQNQEQRSGSLVIAPSVGSGLQGQVNLQNKNKTHEPKDNK